MPMATTASYLLADYSLLDSQAITFTSYNKEQSFRIAVKWNLDFEN
jgi:inner membrane protein